MTPPSPLTDTDAIAGRPGEDLRSDAELIARLRGRGADRDSTDAFATLYGRHQQAARALARQLARSPADADDLVAGAFTRMLEILRAGRGPTEAFRAYLLTSVRHLAYDRSRAERRLDLTDDIADVHGIDPDGTIVPFTDPALAGLERTLAARAFATLPERWQAVLWHLEVEGDSPADIAPLFGLTANAVSALGYRAREGLRQAYLQEHLASGSGRWDRRHRETGEKLGAYTRGGLARREAQRVEAHLAECGECRALADELRDVNAGMVRSVVAPLVLGAGLVGYLASRGSTGPLAFDASTGELAIAGGGALGVLGALTGITGAPRRGAAPDRCRRRPRPRGRGGRRRVRRRRRRRATRVAAAGRARARPAAHGAAAAAAARGAVRWSRRPRCSRRRSPSIPPWPCPTSPAPGPGSRGAPGAPGAPGAGSRRRCPRERCRRERDAPPRGRRRTGPRRAPRGPPPPGPRRRRREGRTGSPPRAPSPRGWWSSLRSAVAGRTRRTVP